MLVAIKKQSTFGFLFDFKAIYCVACKPEDAVRVRGNKKELIKKYFGCEKFTDIEFFFLNEEEKDRLYAKEILEIFQKHDS